MNMKLLCFFLFIVIFFSCTYKKKESRSTTIIEILDKDSLYTLDNGMKIFFNKGTFSEPGINMEYIIIENLDDFVNNKLLTLTDKKEHLLTLGMTKLVFRNSEGIVVQPDKEFTLFSKPHNRKDVKTFVGNTNHNGNVVWSEFKAGKFYLDFTPTASGSMGLHDLTVSSGKNLSNYLDSTFSKHIFHDSIKAILRFNIIGNICELDTLITQSSEYSKLKWLIENEIRKIKLVGTSTGYYKNMSRSSVYIESFDSTRSKYDFRNRSVITTTRTGWFNFDAYINGNLSVLDIVCKDSSNEFRIVSKNLERSMTEEKLSEKKRRFEVPIVNESEKMILIKINNGIVIDQKEMNFTINKQTINW